MNSLERYRFSSADAALLIVDFRAGACDDAGLSGFSRSDSERIARYPQRISWNDVAPEDQDAFRSLRSRLREVAELVADAYPGATELKAHVSMLNPNGRSPEDMSCCAAGTRWFSGPTAVTG